MDDRDIARWRLRTQRLTGPRATSAHEVVGELLAVQAENASQAAWAVAARTATPDAGDLAKQLDDGSILRTHVLRPTWHFVTADDIVWLVELTAPRNQPVMVKQLRAEGYDDAALGRASDAVVQALTERGHLTRSELAAALSERGLELTGFQLMLLLGHIEFTATICSGRPSNGEHTYALMSERVPSPRRLERDGALAELALRYVTGHGPATERDLAYWATLTITDARAGLAQMRDRLESFEHDSRTFWHTPGEAPPTAPQEPAGHLLQILDETYRGFQDSRWVLDADGIVPRARETAIGMSLVDAQLLAGMKRTLSANVVTFQLSPHRPLTQEEVQAIEQAAARYADFLGLTPALVIT